MGAEADAGRGGLELEFDRLLDPAAIVLRIGDARVQRELDRLRELYERNHPLRTAPDTPPRVPKIIHQVWMGSPVPADLQALTETWKRLHPDWEYRLWTDAEIAAWDFGTKDLFEKADCFAQKCDILRSELVCSFGGVYVDMDYECFKPIDFFADRYDFFGTSRNILVAHVGWPQIWPSPIVVCSSFFGARAGHPILRTYLERIRAHWDDEARFRFSKDELTPMAIFAMGGESRVAQIKREGLRTYLPFHEVALELAGESELRDIVLPTAFFNPIVFKASMLYAMPDFWQKCLERKLYLPVLRSYRRVPPYAYGNHISKARWLN